MASINGGPRREPLARPAATRRFFARALSWGDAGGALRGVSHGDVARSAAALARPMAPTRDTAAPRLQAPARVDFFSPRVGRAPWFEDYRYQQTLDAITKTPATRGNWTRLLLDGRESFREKVAAVRRADVIFLKIYQFDDDTSGRAFAHELAQAARRGAQVYVQYGLKSFYGAAALTLMKLRGKTSPPPTLNELASLRNVTLIPNDFPKRWSEILLRRDHEKFLITWRRGEPVKLIMGGMNISDGWVRGGVPGACTQNGIQYRDTDVEIIGPAAQRAVTAFILDCGLLEPRDLESIIETNNVITSQDVRSLYPPNPEDSLVRFVRNRPGSADRGQQSIKDLYVSLLSRVPAGESVRLQNAYFLPTGRLQRAICEAAERGVKVKIVINASSSPEFEARLMARAGRSLFRRLLKKCRAPQNLRFHEFVGSPLTGHNSMHQKVASFGATGPCLIGSSNLDQQSLHFNKEDVALIYDPQTRASFDAMWERDVHNTQHTADGRPIITTRLLTQEALDRESAFGKVKGWLLYHVFRGIL